MRRNILIASAGRRGKLIAIFRAELAKLLPGAAVIAADARPELSAACHLAERFAILPRCNDPTYAERLAGLCVANDIGLIVPTIDPELPVQASLRERLAALGVTAVVSDSPFVDLCRDKRATAKWFAAHGLRVPRLFDPAREMPFPLFAKPYDGSCSRDVRIIRSEDELSPALRADPRMLFMEYLSAEEHDEYTIDMYYDRQGKLRCLVPRLRLETRAGEVSKGRTRRVAALERLSEQFALVVGARGCITMQVFVNRQTECVYGIEINPRFGGGFPLSYEAGANFPRWIIEEYLLQKDIDYFDGWESDLTMLRYDDHVVVRSAAA